MNKDTILVNSSSCPSLASVNLMRGAAGNSSLNSVSICSQVSVAVLLENFHGKYLVMKIAKNLPAKRKSKFILISEENYFTHHQQETSNPWHQLDPDCSPIDNILLTNCHPCLIFCHFLKYNFWKFPFWRYFKVPFLITILSEILALPPSCFNWTIQIFPHWRPELVQVQGNYGLKTQEVVVDD